MTTSSQSGRPVLIAVEAANAEGWLWQTVHPAAVDVILDGSTAQQVAQMVADNEEFYMGGHPGAWRVRVWEGDDEQARFTREADGEVCHPGATRDFWDPAAGYVTYPDDAEDED